MLITRKLWKPLIAVAAIIAITVIAFWAAKLVRENDAIRMFIEGYGYLGIFVISFISGFNLIVPIPAISFLPLFLEVGLGFVTTIVIITIGMTIADFIAFILGASGRMFAQASGAKKVLPRLVKLREKYNSAPLVLLFFYASLAPLPNEILLIPLGFLGYRSFYVLPILLAGNAVFNTLVAVGIINLFAII